MLAYPPAGPKIYVDESLDAASTAAPTGAESAPYPSSVAALLAQGPAIALYVKKAKAGADEAAPSFEPITSSGLKKAKKLYEAEKKKADKLAAGKEKADRDAAEARKREELKREEASKVVLVEDASLPKATRVRSPASCAAGCCFCAGARRSPARR